MSEMLTRGREVEASVKVTFVHVCEIAQTGLSDAQLAIPEEMRGSLLDWEWLQKT